LAVDSFRFFQRLIQRALNQFISIDAEIPVKNA
jgi:hypothetical protein